MRVFIKWDLPFRMHSVRSRRIPNIVADLELNWRGIFERDHSSSRGSHGWDNLYEDMQAIFVAHGPSFRKGAVGRPFENVQLYNLMCALLNVTPADNNGTWGALHPLLSDPPNDWEMTIQDFPDMPPILRMPPDANIRPKRSNTCRVLNKHSKDSKPELVLLCLF